MWKKHEPQTFIEQGYSGSSMASASPTADIRPEELGNAVIGASIQIRGDISGGQDLLVEGKVEGKITLKSNTVTLGKTGKVQGDIHARTVQVFGTLNGNLFGEEQVVVHESGNIQGDIVAPRVTLQDGAKLKGAIDMNPVPADNARRQAAVQENKSEQKSTSTGTTSETLRGV